MNIAVVGTGYVGLTTAVSLALKGHSMTGIDADPMKVERLKQGTVPFFEPGMEEALRCVQTEKRIRFTCSLHEGVADADVVFLCVGTPPCADGQADLTCLWEAVDELVRTLPYGREKRLLVIKSTVPVGTGDQVAARFSERDDVLVVSNPEFLREGSALADSLEPSRIVIGADDEEAGWRMEQVYAEFPGPRICTSRVNAELIKYASNAYLATRISFVNELSRLCERLGADISVVTRGMGLDNRIGASFLQAGIGYGGSCFPKDTAALITYANQLNAPLTIVESGIRVNESQVMWFFDKIKQSFDSLSGKRIAVLGLSFKPHTDDIREAPSLRLIPLLRNEGAEVIGTDPAAVPHARRLFPDVPFVRCPYEALEGADAAVLATEWTELIRLDWLRVKSLMKNPLLFDGRNAWPGEELVRLGFTCKGVGRS